MTQLLERPVREEPASGATIDERGVPGRHGILRGAIAGLAVGIGLGSVVFFTLRPAELEAPAPAAIAAQRADAYAEAMRTRWLDIPANAEAVRYAGYAEALERAWLDVPANVEAARYAAYAEHLLDEWLEVPANVEALRYRRYAEWMAEHHGE